MATTSTETAFASPPQRSRLRTRLAIALVLVFIPVFALVVLIHVEALGERRDSRVQSLATIDQTLAASLDGYARGVETFTQSAVITLRTAASAGIPLSQPGFGVYFQELAKSYNVRSIFVTDLDGRVLAGTTGNVGFDISSRPYYQALKAGAKSVWSGGLAGQISGQTTLAYGQPVHTNDGTLIAYLFVAFYPPQIDALLPTNLPADANISLIDNGGVVLLSSRNTDPEKPTRDVSDSPEFKQAAAGDIVLIRSQKTPVDEDKRYGAFVSVKSTGWVVGISRPADAIDGPLNRQFVRNLVLLGGAFVIAIIAMSFVASRLSSPLTALAASAAAIAAGREPVPTKLASDYEVMQLQQAMDSMARAIREREVALQGQTASAQRLANQLARLHASRNALAPLLPPDQICAIVVTEAIDAIGAQAGAVLLVREDRKTFRVAAQSGYSEVTFEELDSLPLDEQSPFSEALTRGAPVLFHDAGEQIAAFPNQTRLKENAGTNASAFLPLQAQGQVLGVLVLGFDGERTFSQGDVDLMFAFANQAAQSLHRSTLFAATERSNQAKDEFLGIIAHELRTPVTSIFGGARLLNNPALQLPQEARDELLKNVEIESDRMVSMVENLLLLARAELGREPEKTRLSTAEVLEQAQADFLRGYPGRDIQVESRLNEDAIWSDETTLRQVLLNLLSNAAKYSPADGPIDILFDEVDDGIEIHVMDRGPGVKPEELSLIFDSFYRSPTTARQAAGKGIGLAVCRRLIESLGGHVSARLRACGGLDVTVYLPQSASRSAPEVSNLASPT